MLVAHAAATWFMVGVIWMVQIVHYPLFTRVGSAEFARYERAHTRRMGLLLGVPATLEVVTGAALVWVRPDAVGLPIVLAAGVVLALIWVTTAFVQAPAHGRLTGGYEASEVERLIRTNWWRTAAWTVRGALVAAMVLA